MRQRAFMQIDVFTDRPFLGNPVAVVLDADGLSSQQMQSIARWTNLSETTFVLPATEPGADYQLRIFTPTSELPFAGHPTLGSAFAVRRSGRVDRAQARLVQQCGAGKVSVTVDARADRLWLRLPAAQISPLDTGALAGLADALGLNAPVEVTRIDVGPVWLTLELPDAPGVLALKPDMAALAHWSRDLKATGVTVFGRYAPGSAAGYEVRSFAPAFDVPEDPVCGSGNGCVAVALRQRGRGQDYLARQGRAIGRDGLIAVRFDDAGIEIGGACVCCVEGTLTA